MTRAHVPATRGAGSPERIPSGTHPRRIAAGAFLAATAALACTRALAAQGIAVHPLVQPEVHAAVVVSGTSSALAGIGANMPVGLYVRLGADVLAGNGIGETRGTVVRAGIVARFLADPFREIRWAPYVGGGIAGSWRDGDHGRPALVAVVGTDLPWGRRWNPGVELGIGGGVQLRLTFRRSRTGGR